MAIQTWDGEGGTPFQFVWSKNWSRRSLTASQRAVVALSAESEFSEDVRLGRLTLQAAKRKAVKSASTRDKNAPVFRVGLAFEGHALRSDRLPKTEAESLREALAERLRDLEGFDIRLIGGASAKEASLGVVKPPSHMYADAKTWNPFKGCEFDCSYCKPSFQAQAKRQKERCDLCYRYAPHEHPERLDSIPAAKIVFVCGNGDVKFSEPDYLRRIVEAIRAHRSKPGQVFYLQSKEPACLAPHLDNLPGNVILVTTLETNRDAGYGEVSKAPVPSERYRQFLDLKYPRKVITAEPLLDFDAEVFADWMAKIKPEYVWLGLNSRDKQVKLPEPAPEKIEDLSRRLLSAGIEVRGKHLRGIVMPEGVRRYQD